MAALPDAGTTEPPQGGSLKRYTLGTGRVCHPQETLRRISPHLEAFGITRVGNITGLDRLGIPVFVAVRPNSRSVSTSLGKAAEPIASRVSAIMESVETFHAEFARCTARVETWAQMAREAPVVDPFRLPLAEKSLFSTSFPIPWVEGRDLVGGCPMWVPFELVHTNFCVPRLAGSGCFHASSNGLASGNTLSEAVLHALCEVIERDALDSWWRQSRAFRSSRRIDLSTVHGGVGRSLLDRCEVRGFSVAAWDLTGQLGAPVMLAQLRDRSPEPVLNPVPVATGSGCNPDPAVALTRALTESAQVRLGLIAGSRDDAYRRYYRQALAPEPSTESAATDERGVLDFADRRSLATSTIEGDLDALLERLSAQGFSNVVLVNLSRAGLPVKVARVIVPGMTLAVA